MAHQRSDDQQADQWEVSARLRGAEGALCNDVGFGLAQSRALELRETLLRLNAALTGHRLLRGGIVPGGAALIRPPSASELHAIEDTFEALVDLASSQSTVHERFFGTATLSEDEARELGVVGVVARASGVENDARIAHPFAPMPRSFTSVSENGGDVLSRFRVRVGEARISLAMIRELTSSGFPSSPLSRGPLPERSGTCSGIGIVESWRGTAVHRIEIDDAGLLSRVKVVDPSFFNWPALPVSLADTIVPDFPLANKSFNLSYAGNDL